MLSGFVRWSERRASRASLRASFVGTVWGVFIAPVIWIAVMPLFGGNTDAVLYALAVATLLAMAGCFGSLSLLRRWSK